MLRSTGGYTIVEMMIALVVATLLFAGLSGVLRQATQTSTAVGDVARATEDGRFAMERLALSVRAASELVLPTAAAPSQSTLEVVVPPGPATVRYQLNGQTLVERDANGVDRPLAEGVSRFQVQRIAGARATVVDVQLDVARADSQTFSLQTRVRVGGPG